MLQDLPADVMVYWLAHQKIKKPEYRAQLHWDELEKQDPEAFAQQQAEELRSVFGRPHR